MPPLKSRKKKKKLVRRVVDESPTDHTEEIPEDDQTKWEREFISLALSRFKMAEEAEAANRKESLEDIEFRIGKQWNKNIQTRREQENKPCLTINRITQFCRQVVNEQRQQRPSIQVDPVGDGADVDDAQIWQGLIRHIELSSDAEIAYDTAFEQMVDGGFGYFRIITYYIDEETGEQEIGIKRIKNQFSVYFDTDCEEPDYSDARWAFVISDLPKEVYKSKYPKSHLASISEWNGYGNNSPDWLSKDAARVAEYWFIEEEVEEIKTDGGQPEATKANKEIEPAKPPKKKRTVQWSTINAVEILDAPTKWLGKYIPIVPVLGDDISLDGQRHLAGLIRYAKDPQRAYNYYNSAAAHLIGLTPRIPWMAPRGSFEGNEEKWNSANRIDWPFLEYNQQYGPGGAPLPAPVQQALEPPIEAVGEMLKNADADLHATTGIYQPALGVPKSDQSGAAVRALQKQGDMATSNFSDNFSRAQKFAGRIILDLAPKVYDTARTVRIVKPDQTAESIVIHNGDEQAKEAQEMAQDHEIKKIFDVSFGRYDITITTGPSYQSKRAETVAAMLNLVQSDPEIMQIGGDILVGNMDWPGAKELAKRLKAMLPPQAQDDPQSPEAQLAQAKQELTQMGQQHQVLMQHNTELTQTIKSKQTEMQAKVAIEKYKADTDKLIALAKIQASVTIAEIGSKSQVASDRASFTHDAFVETHGAAHELAMATAQQEHDKEMQQNQQQHEVGTQAADQAASAASQQSAQDATAQQQQAQPDQ